MAEKKKEMTASGSWPLAKGLYWGYIVTAKMGGSSEVRVFEGSVATGTQIDIVPMTAPNGLKSILTTPIKIEKGISVDWPAGATGKLLFLYD